MRGKRMPKRMRMNFFFDSSIKNRSFNNFLHTSNTIRFMAIGKKNKIIRIQFFYLNKIFNFLLHNFRKDKYSIFSAFSLPNKAITLVNKQVLNSQIKQFRNSKPS